MKERHYGIDFLRCVSMLMVVMLHVLGHGGVLSSVRAGSWNYWIAWLLEIIAFPAVNCYALISGYVGINSRGKYHNIIYLWLQVAFYSVVIALLFYFIAPATVESTNIWRFLFPVINRSYWYFTMYFALFFFIPLLNKGICALDERTAKKLVIALCVVFSGAFLIEKMDVLQVIDGSDPFISVGGYSVIWLLVLYIIGGCIARFDLLKIIPTKVLLLGSVGCVLLTIGFKFAVEHGGFAQSTISSGVFVDYLSPTIIGCSIFLLGVFSRIKSVPKFLKGLLKFFVPVSFGVYLVHEHLLVRTYLLGNSMVFAAELNSMQFLVVIFSVVIGIYIFGSLVDYLRLILFEILRIKSLANKLSCVFSKNKNL